ncbi:unnamed protein product [Symbiodinium natans]|uniref:Uncharacterized protein n=1 Tax=Symbiodinium natans TaxID=878477 RepID=A0A812LS73_9DINO|nr:unnamed protein product [Symbiodinium natans]
MQVILRELHHEEGKADAWPPEAVEHAISPLLVMDPQLRQQLEAFYRHTIDDIHSDMQMLKAYANSGAASSEKASFLEVKSASLDPRVCFLPSWRPTSHLFYSGGDKKDAQMDNFLKQDAAQSETEAADIFEDAVHRERHAAKMVGKGERASARADYAQMLEEEEKMEKLMDRAAEDAEEDAMLVLQQDKNGKDIDGQPYTDDPAEGEQPEGGQAR